MLMDVMGRLLSSIFDWLWSALLTAGFWLLVIAIGIGVLIGVFQALAGLWSDARPQAFRTYKPPRSALNGDRRWENNGAGYELDEAPDWEALAVQKGKVGEALVRAELGAIDVVHDILVPCPRPNGERGWTQIDHIVRLETCIVCIETKHYTGQVFGIERESHWTQRVDGKSYRRQNPLRQNYLHLKAVDAVLDEAFFDGHCPVVGLVVFTGDAKFPKGIPPGVCQLPSVWRHLAALNDAHDGVVSDAEWRAVVGSASTSANDRHTHLDDLRKRHGKRRRRL